MISDAQAEILNRLALGCWQFNYLEHSPPTEVVDLHTFGYLSRETIVRYYITPTGRAALKEWEASHG